MATNEWFFGTPENKLGPVPKLSLVAMARANKLTPQTLVWTEGMPKWVPAGTLPFIYAPNTGHDPALHLLLPVGPQSGFAIAAGYLGLFSFIPICAPIAIILGALAISDIKKHPEKRGMGRAITGIVLGSLAIIVTAAIIIS